MIVFRQRFINKIIKLDNYLCQEFGEKVADGFLEKIHLATQMLAKQPYQDE